MSDKQGLSLVIVNYNTPNETINCVKSFLSSANKYKLPFEIIIVDNRSTDSSLSALAYIPDVNIVCALKNDGYGVALNLGAGAAQYDTIILSNSDIVFPDSFCQLVDNFIDLNGVDCLGVKLRGLDGKIQKSTFIEPTVKSLAGEYFNPFLKKMNDPIHPSVVQGIVGALIIVKASVYRAVDGFDGYFFLYSEEVDFCRRVRSAGYTIWYTSDIEVIHIGGQSTKGTSRFSYAELHRSRIKYFSKFYTITQARIFWFITVISFIFDALKSIIKLFLGKETLKGIKSRTLAYFDVIAYAKVIFSHSKH